MLELLHLDSHRVAVNKPWGICVIPGRVEGEPCVRHQLEAQLGRPVWVVHRLDRDTSGVLLFALDAQTHRALNGAFEHGEVSKRYRALVEGKIDEPLTLDSPLIAGRKGKMRPSRPGETGKSAKTLVRPLRAFEKVTWVEAEPLTGRTHQIRVHLSWAGHPLVVDHQYGSAAPFVVGEATLTRTPLHSQRLEVDGLHLEAPLPNDLEQILRVLEPK